MRKKFSVIFLLISFTLIFGCCSATTKNNSVFLVDVSNDIIDKNELNLIWDQNYYKKENVLEEYILEYDGVIYDGFYFNSIIRKCDSYSQNIYFTKEGVQFGIKEGTNDLVFLNLQTNDFFVGEANKIELDNSEENALENARRVASSFVEVDDYELIIGEKKDFSKVVDGENYSFIFYSFTFAKVIDDYYSSDYISIKITSKGDLASLIIGDTNAFEEININNFKSIDINKNIEKKLYEVLHSNYSIIKNEIEYQRICVTPSGKLCIYSSCRVSLMDKRENIINSLVAIVVYI